MKQNFKISVIVPIYNVDKYLDECLSSIVNQTYKNLEIILINDGSTDKSEIICKKYEKEDDRIIVISKENGGVSNARNVGIKNATGEFIAFVDSDDTIDKTYFETLITNSKNNDLTICKFLIFSNKIYKNKNDDNSITRIENNNLILLDKMCLLNTPCCKLFKTEIIKKNNIKFEESISLGEDLLFNLDYFKCIKSVFIINAHNYNYRYHGRNSLTTKYVNNSMKIQFLLIDKITDFFNNTKHVELLNNYRMRAIISIIENEFKNEKISFFKRYINARKIVSDETIQNRIENYKYGYNKIKYKLLKNNLFLLFKIMQKIKIIK